MIDIYHYFESAKYLRDKFQEKKEANPSFSLRAWSRHLGFKSHGPLQQVLAGKRLFPKKYLPFLATSLGLNQKEILYVENLLELEKSKTNEERERYLSRIKELQPRSKREVKFFEIENYKYFQNPLHTVILSMVQRKDFKFNYMWIKKNLLWPSSISEIKEAFQRLVSMGLLIKVDGKWAKRHDSSRSKTDVPSQAVQEYHQKMCDVAAKQIKKQKLTEREYGSFTFNLKEECMSEAKEKIRTFMEDFIDRFSALPGSSNQTYQLNTQLFSILRQKEEKE